MITAELKEFLFQKVISYRSFWNDPAVVFPDDQSPIAAAKLFSGSDHRILELGAGWGEFCIALMEQNPETDYTVFEIKPERIRSLLKKARGRNIHRLRVVPVNFNWFLETILPPQAYNEVFINFPDPWPKRRHWKHRLIQNDFPARLSLLLKEGALVHVVTDYGPYARRILGVFRRAQNFSSLYSDPEFERERPSGRPESRFESMQRAAGKRPYFMSWQYRRGNGRED